VDAWGHTASLVGLIRYAEPLPTRGSSWSVRLLLSRREAVHSSWVLLAYFGPETQLPLLSLIGAMSGLIMVFVRSPIRVVKQWCLAMGRKSTID
jgi:hypothetical protein